jgi:hypothetical protein
MNEQVGRFYQPSGKFTLGGLAVMFAAAIVSGAVIGAGYGFFSFFNRFIYINCIGAAVLGLSVGFIVEKTGVLVKTRNRAIYVLAACAGCVVAEYANMAAWTWAIMRSGFPLDFVIFDPLTLADILERVADEVYRHHFGGKLNGTWIYVAWIVEFGMILGAAILVCWPARTFCERCNKWLPKGRRLGPFQQNPASLRIKARAMAGDLKPLLALVRADKNARLWIELRVASCACGETNCLYVYSGRIPREADRRIRTLAILQFFVSILLYILRLSPRKTKPVMEHYLIDNNTRDAILAEGFGEPPPAPEGAVEVNDDAPVKRRRLQR